MEIFSDWKSLSAALLDDAAVEARSDASTSNLLLLLKDAAHKAVGGQLVLSGQEARWDCNPCLLAQYQGSSVQGCFALSASPSASMYVFCSYHHALASLVCWSASVWGFVCIWESSKISELGHHAV